MQPRRGGAGVMLIGCDRGADQALEAPAQEPKVEVLAKCVSATRHELDDATGYYQSLGDIGDGAIAACRQAVEALPESVVAQEHLGRALLAVSNRPPRSSGQEAADVTVKAARAGSLWAQSQALMFGAEGFDRETVIRELGAAGAAQPDQPGPKVLLAQTLIVDNGNVLPSGKLQQPVGLLQAASRLSGGPAMVSAMASHLMSFGLCGRTVSPWVEVVRKPEPDLEGEEGCAVVLQIAANADDPMAHLALGTFHLRNAHYANSGRLSRAAALDRFEESKRSAKLHFARVAQSNSMLSSAARDLLAKVDDVQMASSPSEDAGADLLMGLFGLMLSSPSSSEAKKPSSSYEDVLEEQAERRRQECADARARAAFTSPGGSNEDWGMRYHAANCP